VFDFKTEEYIASLPEVDTSRLAEGTLFLAGGRIYQVIATGTSGFHKARQWRKPEGTEVALVPGSFLSKYLPLVPRGRLLPVFRSRMDLTQDGKASCFVFPTESLALDAAYLDVALVQSSGAYVRNHGQDPAFAVTDGVHVFRLYYYRESVHGRRTNLASLQVSSRAFTPQPHTAGPSYWRLLPDWNTQISLLDVTQPSMPVVKPSSDGDETLPTISI
jgi:hypothetical protein